MVSPYLDRPLRELWKLWPFEREWVNMIYGNIRPYACFAYGRDGRPETRNLIMAPTSQQAQRAVIPCLHSDRGTTMLERDHQANSGQWRLEEKMHAVAAAAAAAEKLAEALRDLGATELADQWDKYAIASWQLYSDLQTQLNQLLNGE